MQHIISTVLFLTFSTLTLNCGQWDRLNNRDLGPSAKLESGNGVVIHFNQKSAYRSDDKGLNWTDISDQFPRGVLSLSWLDSDIIALSTSDASGAIIVVRSSDQGLTWRTASAFSISPQVRIVDLIREGGKLFAVTSTNLLYVSIDRGITWKPALLPVELGSLLDLAQANGIWAACGTESTWWASDIWGKWNVSPTPAEIGNLRCVESAGGRIWGGADRGACWFDFESRSWVVDTDGLIPYAQIMGSPLSFITEGSVVFGLFATLDGTQNVYSRQIWDGQWRLLYSFGLPTFNEISRKTMVVVGDRILLYHRGNDITTYGIYSTSHNIAVSVEEQDGNQSSKLNIVVYPLPASNNLNVRSDAVESTEFRLIDIGGFEVIYRLFTGEVNIDLSVCLNGTYVAICQSNGVQRTSIVTIQR